MAGSDVHYEAMRDKLSRIKADITPMIDMTALDNGPAIGPDCPRCGKPWPWVTVRRGKRISACHHDVEFTIPGYGGRLAG